MSFVITNRHFLPPTLWRSSARLTSQSARARALAAVQAPKSLLRAELPWRPKEARCAVSSKCAVDGEQNHHVGGDAQCFLHIYNQSTTTSSCTSQKGRYFLMSTVTQNLSIALRSTTVSTALSATDRRRAERNVPKSFAPSERSHLVKENSGYGARPLSAMLTAPICTKVALVTLPPDLQNALKGCRKKSTVLPRFAIRFQTSIVFRKKVDTSNFCRLGCHMPVLECQRQCLRCRSAHAPQSNKATTIAGLACASVEREADLIGEVQVRIAPARATPSLSTDMHTSSATMAG